MVGIVLCSEQHECIRHAHLTVGIYPYLTVSDDQEGLAVPCVMRFLAVNSGPYYFIINETVVSFRRDHLNHAV